MAFSAEKYTVTCQYCKFPIGTSETSPTIYCRKCNRRFPNPYAAPEELK